MAPEPEKPTDPQDISALQDSRDAEKGTEIQTGSGSTSGSTSSRENAMNLTKMDSKIIQGNTPEDDLDATLAHLPEHERAILKEQLFIPETKVGFFTLYRYGTRKDTIIFTISCICSIAAGAVMPLFTV